VTSFSPFLPNSLIYLVGNETARSWVGELFLGVVMKKIAIVGTLDTKFEEMGFIRDFVQKKGHNPVVIDAGIMGTVPFRPQISRDKVAEAATKIVPAKPMIGVTTRGIMRYLHWIKPALEARGYEVVVTHCIGKVGEGTFETLIRQGLFSAVLDLCTGEVLEELNGGSLRAGPTRLEGAGDMGIPQIIAPGCMEYWHWPGSGETISSW
jgi:uncharacterized protein (UPF0261 family)